MEGKTKWIMYGKGSGRFNKDFHDKEVKDTVQIDIPTPRYYYRTISCQLLKQNQTHYFNIFTRPLGITKFPVMFMQGSKPDLEGNAKSSDVVSCEQKHYYRSKLDDHFEVNRDKSKDTFVGAPFQYYWLFPGKKALTDDENSHQRPSRGEVYWGKQTMYRTDADVFVENQPKIPKAMVRTDILFCIGHKINLKETNFVI